MSVEREQQIPIKNGIKEIILQYKKRGNEKLLQIMEQKDE